MTAIREDQIRALDDKMGNRVEKECLMRYFEDPTVEENKFGDGRSKMTMNKSAKPISQRHLGEVFTLSPEGRALDEKDLGKVHTLGSEGRD